MFMYKLIGLVNLNFNIVNLSFTNENAYLSLPAIYLQMTYRCSLSEESLIF